ncbi:MULTISPECIES: Zn-ribbon domain-containing OB-fold protein [Methylobacterium]|uniref:Predicted nucleic-acid-binding protein containing a Zn-ribbon n=2 Tax=Methylobacterium TaxID=407 RepID=A0A0C6FSU1_9HYPH|nr:OB-fold domain-containing protein [Methylobacterium aquaticum]BAQ50132.1 predicted nucleic-acid-binding protein containing a Zn-ribbon [Methylobacterium aquaticum]
MSPDPTSREPADWTRGGEGLAFARCRACGHVQYFRRPFCPACGGDDLAVAQASGRGRVYALTTVARAPSRELSIHAPYVVALIDAEEGFRFMAHAAEGLAIDAPVRTAFRAFGTGCVPYCVPEDGE